MPVELRGAHGGDAQAIARIARESLPEVWTPAALRAALERPTVSGVVAALGPELVGFALAARAADEGEILALAVEPARRGAGLGRALLESLLEQLRAAGARRVHLEVRCSHTSALALYESLGFRTSRRRARYYRDGEDALELGVAL
ncbi:MAG: ribosomal protein S18-alanine N-acetyltransferase [Myxococcota bacterium]